MSDAQHFQDDARSCDRAGQQSVDAGTVADGSGQSFDGSVTTHAHRTPQAATQENPVGRFRDGAVVRHVPLGVRAHSARGHRNQPVVCPLPKTRAVAIGVPSGASGNANTGGWGCPACVVRCVGRPKRHDLARVVGRWRQTARRVTSNTTWGHYAPVDHVVIGRLVTGPTGVLGQRTPLTAQGIVDSSSAPRRTVRERCLGGIALVLLAVLLVHLLWPEPKAPVDVNASASKDAHDRVHILDLTIDRRRIALSDPSWKEADQLLAQVAAEAINKAADGMPAPPKPDGAGDAAVPSGWKRSAKLMWETGSPNFFADCVSLSGDRLLVGAEAGDWNYPTCLAYFFELREGVWQQTAASTIVDDALGIKVRSVTLSGDRAFIGAKAIARPYSFGAVYVLHRQSDGSWRQTDKLTGWDSGGGASFGHAVAIYDERVMVGDPGGFRGAAYVLEHDTTEGWLRVAKLKPDDYSQENGFGSSVSMIRDRALIAADSGAYVYERERDGSWRQSAKLVPHDFAQNRPFQFVVALSAARALVGVNWFDAKWQAGGAGYVFEQRPDGSWKEMAKLVPAPVTSGDYVIDLALSGDRAVLGASRYTNHSKWTDAGYIFERQADGTWTQTAKLTAEDATDRYIFGLRVGVSGDRVVLGAPCDFVGNSSDPGAVYVYDR